MLNTGKLTVMTQTLIILGVTQHLEKAIFVLKVLELWVRGADSPIADVFDHSRLRQAVEI